MKQLTNDLSNGDVSIRSSEEISMDGKCYRFCCFITQMCIEDGEPLFSVDYQDPDFQDNHIGDDDDGEIILFE